MNRLFERADREWRDPAQVVSQWAGAAEIDPRLFEHRVTGPWWETLAQLETTLLVSREYEHFVLAVGIGPAGPSVSYLPLPHPSGIAVDHHRGLVYVASTRNPNQLFELAPVNDIVPRLDQPAGEAPRGVLLPRSSRTLPGCLYLHDLAFIGDRLHGNAVGENAVVRFDGSRAERVWWPRAAEVDGEPIFGRNHLQLNSIAAGDDLESSFFSASTDRVTARRPGHRNFPVDKRGVVFSGATREPVVRGLTRPHSARLHGGTVWVDNSGYGEVGVVQDGRFEPVVRLPGWTRGLCFHGGYAFAGTSRILPRFRQYAPGIDMASSVCGIHAIDLGTGELIGSLTWPNGNQIFAIERTSAGDVSGFPFSTRSRNRSRERNLFYAFSMNRPGGL